MENESDTNMSISSWKEIDMDNDANEFKKNGSNFEEKQIYIDWSGTSYQINLQDKCFLKYTPNCFYNDPGDRAKKALNSAFVSCFSHTPYPVGITYNQGSASLVWRYDEGKKQYAHEYDVFFNYNWYKNDQQLQDTFHKMTKEMQKHAITYHVHQFFFNLYDRKLDNLILTNNKLIYLYLAECFFTNPRSNSVFQYIEKFCDFYESVSKNNKDLIKWKDETINKINNIDYDVFIKRYIRNCIVFEIPCDVAFNKLREFVTYMETFDEQYNDIKEKSTNMWLSSLQEACKKFYSSFLKNAMIVNIKSGAFREQFAELFNKQQKAISHHEKETSMIKNSLTKENDGNNVRNDKDNNDASINQKEESIDIKDSSEKNSNNDCEIKHKNTRQEEKEKGNTKLILENENEDTDLNNNPADHGICPGCNCNCWPFNKF